MAYRFKPVDPHTSGYARYLERSGRRAVIDPNDQGLVVRHGKRYVKFTDVYPSLYIGGRGDGDIEIIDIRGKHLKHFDYTFVIVGIQIDDDTVYSCDYASDSIESYHAVDDPYYGYYDFVADGFTAAFGLAHNTNFLYAPAYSSGSSKQHIVKVNKSDLLLAASVEITSDSPFMGRNNIFATENFVYVTGDNGNTQQTILRYNASDLSKADETLVYATYDGRIQVTGDEGFIYVYIYDNLGGGNEHHYIYKYTHGMAFVGSAEIFLPDGHDWTSSHLWWRGEGKDLYFTGWNPDNKQSFYKQNKGLAGVAEYMFENPDYKSEASFTLYGGK
jgi:hypothetical protein